MSAYIVYWFVKWHAFSLFKHKFTHGFKYYFNNTSKQYSSIYSNIKKLTPTNTPGFFLKTWLYSVGAEILHQPAIRIMDVYVWEQRYIIVIVYYHKVLLGTPLHHLEYIYIADIIHGLGTLHQ